MLARVTAADGLLVDRYYRGAVVMAGEATYAIPEVAIRLVESAVAAGASAYLVTEDERELAEVLVARGILRAR